MEFLQFDCLPEDGEEESAEESEGEEEESGSITSEGSAPVFPNSMLLLSTRMRSSGPMVEAGTAGTGSGMKTSCTVSGASGNGRGWTAGSWGGGGEGGSTLVPHVFFGTALLTRIGTRLCSLWQD